MRIEKYFSEAIKSGLLQFEIDQKTFWLVVNYRENLTYSETSEPENWKWTLLCAQSLDDYRDKDGFIDDLKLVNRITMMLAETLRSTKQDVNGLIK